MSDTFEFESSQGNKYLVPIKYKECTSVSQIIRSMTRDGFTKGKIAKSTGIRYQHVRNVLLEEERKKLLKK